jgi:hypothetical protein
MNERVPDSSGLPLRAMVMVLLFFGLIFLLVGFQAMGSGDDDSDDSSTRPVATTTTTATSTSTSATPVQKAEVRVFNVGGDEGAAARMGDRLREAGWNVTETGNLTVSELPATTVFFGPADQEEAAAQAVGKLIDAPVQPRIPEIAEQPPGVIVLVTG